MTTQPQPEFTTEELKFIALQFVNRDYDLGAAILTKIKAVLPEPPVRCFHCREVQASENAYEQHLRVKHHYGESREDGSVATAWKAFHTRRV